MYMNPQKHAYSNTSYISSTKKTIIFFGADLKTFNVRFMCVYLYLMETASGSRREASN